MGMIHGASKVKRTVDKYFVDDYTSVNDKQLILNKISAILGIT